MCSGGAALDRVTREGLSREVTSQVTLHVKKRPLRGNLPKRVCAEETASAKVLSGNTAGVSD